ncbi:MAG: hypothetical protein ACR2L1_03760 [Pyrinomonadaceae bacterium]
MEKSGANFYMKTEADLEQEFEQNKKLNAKSGANSKSDNLRLPENMIEYFEYLIIENIRSIKFLEKENIPAEIKSHRLKHLEKQQQSLLDRLDELKISASDANSAE